jgi:cytochrome b subunit of formate dehydrogenase
MLDVLEECGHCHDDPKLSDGRLHTYVETYNASYHGQVTQLGSMRAARCSDCHGAHDMLPQDDPNSRVHPNNLIKTCSQIGCHPKANANFVSFDPHADIHDRKLYPLLWGIWLYFMIVMGGAFGVFGLHTVLWFVRTLIDRAHTGHKHSFKHKRTAIRRFNTIQRINHVLVAVPFLGLTGTGIPLFFADKEWASGIAWCFGGIEMAGFWHRFFAVFLLGNFVLHFFGIIRSIRAHKGPFLNWLFGPTSMLPKWKDVKDFIGMFRWFLFGRTMPRFDHWTYFEKFDYWCEIGGSFIIGTSGLMLWFPELAASILPGWAFNIAMIAHGYEALLAIGFIFTIHFFNANLRPGKFPVDTVIFSGRLPEAEFKEERPEEYNRLKQSGELKALRVREWPTWKYRVAIILGSTAQILAITVLVLMILAGLDLL